MVVEDPRPAGSMTIRGEKGKGEVLLTADGASLNWRSSLAVRNHSPTGPAWGYGGSGPAQLALGIVRSRGLFEIEVDDGGGFRAATTAEVDAVRRQRELFEAAEYRHSASTRPKVRATSTSVERLRYLVALMDEAVRGWVADGGPPAAVCLVGVPVAGSGGPRGARICSVRRRRPVAGSTARGLPASATARSRLSWATGWRRGSRRADRTDAGAEVRGPGVPSPRERAPVAVRPGALDG